VYNNQRTTALAVECITEAKMHDNKKAALIRCSAELNETKELRQSNEAREMDLSGLYSEIKELNEEYRVNNTKFRQYLISMEEELNRTHHTLRDSITTLLSKDVTIFNLNNKINLLEATLKSHNIT